jgi:DNA excision repair protein ERCC-3
VLVEVHAPKYAEVRDALARFAELIKSPEHVHTCQISPLSIWNAVAAGCRLEEMIAALTAYAKYDVPKHVLKEIEDYASRYGRLSLVKAEGGQIPLRASDTYLAEEIV